MKKILIGILTGILAIGLVACGADSKEDGTKDAGAKKTIKIAATANPAGKILEVAKADFEAKGYKLEVKIFDDYKLPNRAVDEGSVDANLFQHKFYLDNFNKENGTNIVSVGNIYIPRGGIYSKKVKSFKELKNGAEIAVPNDATNLTRMLRFLEAQGLFKLGEGELLTKNDIIENPKNFKIREVDAAQIPRVLEDVDLATINANYAIEAGLSPSKDSLAQEKDDSPFTNILAVDGKNKDEKWVTDLKESLKSDVVKKFLDDNYDQGVILAKN